MLREYEFTLITSAQMTDEESKKLLEHYEAVFLADGGEIVKKSDWGTKKLAFPIKNQYRGRYVHYDYTGLAKNLTEAERLMRIDERVLRYMSVRIGENVDVSQRRAELAKAEALAAQQKAERMVEV